MVNGCGWRCRVLVERAERLDPASPSPWRYPVSGGIRWYPVVSGGIRYLEFIGLSAGLNASAALRRIAGVACALHCAHRIRTNKILFKKKKECCLWKNVNL
jgi:hypothetical protein